MLPILYPIELEQWWVDEARRLTSIQALGACLKSFEADVGRLSDIFTIARGPGFGNYTSDDRALMAYGLFFFPQTFVRTGIVLSEWSGLHGLPPRDSKEPFRILDLGCGLGAASFAALTHLTGLLPGRSLELTVTDTSLTSLAWLKKLFDARQNLWPDARLEVNAGNLLSANSDKKDHWDLILVSFALNEACETLDGNEARTWLRAQIDSLKPMGSLMIIEPAGESTSPGLERLRDWIAESKIAQILGPCLHDGPCPLLLKGSAYCHEVRRWRIPESVEFLNRRLLRSIQDLKFSFSMLARPDLPRRVMAQPAFRMIAPMHKVPGRLLTTGCSADGHVYEYELLTRHLDKAEVKVILSFERGDVIQTDDPELIGDRNIARIKKTIPWTTA